MQKNNNRRTSYIQNLPLEIWLVNFPFQWKSSIFPINKKQQDLTKDDTCFFRELPSMHSLVTAVFQKLCPSNQCESYIQILINHVLYYIFTFIIFIHLGTFWSQNLPNESRFSPSSSILEPPGTPGVKPKDKLRPEALSPTHLKHMLVKLDHETPSRVKIQKIFKSSTQEMEVWFRWFSFSIGWFLGFIHSFSRV